MDTEARGLLMLRLMPKLDTLEALDLVDTEVDILEDTMDMEDMEDTEARGLLMLKLMLKLDTSEALDLVDTEVDILEDTMDMEDIEERGLRMLKLGTLEAMDSVDTEATIEDTEDTTLVKHLDFVYVGVLDYK